MKKKTEQVAFPDEKQCKICKFRNKKLSRPWLNQKTGKIENSKSHVFCDIQNSYVNASRECPLMNNMTVKRSAGAPSKMFKYEVICKDCDSKLIEFFAEKTSKEEREIEFANMIFTDNLLGYRKNNNGRLELHCVCRGSDSVRSLAKYGNRLTAKGNLYKIKRVKDKKGDLIERRLI